MAQVFPEAISFYLKKRSNQKNDNKFDRKKTKFIIYTIVIYKYEFWWKPKKLSSLIIFK